MKKIYEIDGRRFSTLEEFARHFSEVVLREYCWRGNLDAFNDILRGGFGTPEDGFVLLWRNSEISKVNLGYAKTTAWLQERIQNCHPSNVDRFREELEEARKGIGPTLFEIIVDTIRRHGPEGEEPEDGVELILE